MSEMVFAERVKAHFGFLKSEYSFQIVLEKNSDRRPQTDGIVEYGSDTTGVVIDSELGSAAAWFYRIKDGRDFELDPVIINEYLTTTEKERELLLSIDPSDRFAASTLSNQRSLLLRPEWRIDNMSTEDGLERYLANYADWIRNHADLSLRGNFSKWPDLYEYKVHRARADHLRRGKSELRYVQVKGTDGSLQLVKQSMFQKQLEHVEKLKKEFSS